LTDLAELFPDLAARFDAVIHGLWDLNDVVKRGYCHPGFKGSTSIKKVLPVMVPELGTTHGDRRRTIGVGAFGLMRVGV